jgi:hypothetical protein
MFFKLLRWNFYIVEYIILLEFKLHKMVLVFNKGDASIFFIPFRNVGSLKQLDIHRQKVNF